MQSIFNAIYYDLIDTPKGASPACRGLRGGGRRRLRARPLPAGAQGEQSTYLGAYIFIYIYIYI